jgi:RHS repeat-associated protein
VKDWLFYGVTTINYTYDAANRLTSVDGVSYTWDANGNLMSDGVNTYTYDSANRLISVANATTASNFVYNGLGDRLQETVNGQTTTYLLDLAAGLTQVLSDGSLDYLYGLDRIAQANGTGLEYFLGDALGSVRQMTDGSGAVTLAKSYAPFGDTGSSVGSGTTSYGFTNEYTDQGLINLRSRLYDPSIGRFLTQDSWQGNYNRPLSLNRWNYVEGNPINYTDQNGHCIFTGIDTLACIAALSLAIPVIAGITTAAWDYSVTQGGGYGGMNWDRPECIEWYQVLDAGKSGFLGAISSESQMLASIPLGPTYLMAYLVYHENPAQVNMILLSSFGLDDEYAAAIRNHYFVAGQQGGNAALTYISLATFLKGIPQITLTSSPIFAPIVQPGGLLGNNLILSLSGIEVVGGNGALVYVGAAGMMPQLSMISGGGGIGPQNKAQGMRGEDQVHKILQERGLDILGEEVNIQVDTPNGVRIRRVDFLARDSYGNIFAIEVKTGGGMLSSRQASLDAIMANQGGAISSSNVLPRYNVRLSSIETIYIRLP